MLTTHDLRPGLKTRVFGSKIFTFDKIDSTNNCAKALAGCWASEGTVVIAEEQTAGRGRLGKPWLANPNENLTFSLILRPKVPPEAVNLLPLYVAVSLAEAVEQSTGLRVECKWPNDLLVNRKKIGGILIEGSVKQNIVEYAVVGIGINVNQRSFPGELNGKATSLSVEAGREIDRKALFRDILRTLEQHYGKLQSSGLQNVVPLWLSHSSMVNKEISISQNGSIISGVVKGLSPDGGLILKTNGTEQTLFAGDVSVLQM